MASEIKVDTVSEKTSANGVTIDGVNIKDSKIVTANSVDSDVYVDGSIDTAHIADLNVTTGKIAADAITAAKIADNAVVTAGINADAVTGAKIADDAINSEHYTDGSIDTAHIADGQVTTAKLASAVLTGATDIGAAIVDADLFLVDDGAGGTLRKTAASRIKTYVGGFDVSSITGATALTVEPAATDEMILSDAGTLKRLDMTHLYGLPACNVGGGTSINPAHNTNTLVPWTVEGYDYGGCFNHTTGSVTLNGLTAPAHSFTPNVPGIYSFTTNIYWAGEGADGDAYISINHWINNDHYIDMCIGFMEHGHFDDNNLEANGTVCIPMNGTGDYYQTKIWNTTGEAPELNFGYSSLTIHRIAGLPVASRPNYG